MLKYILSALICSAASFLRAETVVLKNHGSLEVGVPSGWKLTQREIPDLGHNISITPPAGTNAKCLITIMYPPQPAPIDKAKLRSQLDAASQRFVSGSVEQKVDIFEYSLSNGYGVYATFTDANLVGKPTQPGNYKVMNPGVIQFADDVIASVTVFSEDAQGAEQKAIIQAVSALKFIAEK